MYRGTDVKRRRIVLTIAFPILLPLCTLQLWSQQQGLSYTPSTLIDPAQSRAEKEAEQLVSLSADQIIGILHEETGLLLQVKRALVRKAYEQGRILDPSDLTDETLYRLIVEDQNIRVIATREIEDRFYVRAKPSREELARDLPCRQAIAEVELKAQPTLDTKSSQEKPPANQTQEEAYWSKHDEDINCDLGQYLPYGQLGSVRSLSQPTQPPIFPQQNLPQQSPQTPTAPSNTPGRQLQMARMYSGDLYGTDADRRQTAIMPDELPNILSASQTASPGLSGKGMLGQESQLIPSGFAGMPGGSMGGSNGLPIESLMNHEDSDSGFGEEQKRLENQSSLSLLPTYPKLSHQPQLRQRPNPYADVPSLYDLYSQYPRQSPVLDRFGIDVFRNGTGNLEELPMDIPAGPDYMVGPGDGLTIDLTGGVSERLRRVVDREGRVTLPEVGGVEVAGHNLGDVQHLVRTVLRSQFRDLDVDVSLSRIRTVRVYVVGDVERPGGYDVSSLSTPLNALYAAAGPTPGGSLRVVRHYRGKQLVEQVDLYDLLLHGVSGNMQRLEAGDTIEVPPLTGQVMVEGMVRRPAIYELNGERSLAEVLQLAGGVLPTGTLRHIDVERVQDHESRTMLRLDIPESNNDEQVSKALEDFRIQDGDKIKITPILPFTDKTVYLDGHVSRPGEFAYREGMKVTDLIKSYKDLLPEPSINHAEIIRLAQPDDTPVVIAFNLGDALAGKDQDIALKPFDTVRVFSKYDFEDPPIITINGEVRYPGDHLTNGTPHLRDAIYLAGGITPDALLDDVQVYRKTSGGKIEVISVNLAKALAGDEKYNVVLKPKDRVFVHRDLNKLDPQMVAIEGEVAHPGKYPLSEDMTAAQLVRLAGGFKRGAYTEQADLTRYEVQQGTKLVSDRIKVPIARAMHGEEDSDVRLRDGDVLTIGEISDWQDVGATIQVKGEVAHPGGYGIEPGERLSSIIARAGGFLPNAYPYGAIFERVELRDMEEKDRADLIERIQVESRQVKIVPEMDQDDQNQAKAAVLQYKKMIDNLQKTPPAGRLVIHVSADMKRWANTPADIQVRAGDTIYIPKRPGMVLVDGSVYNPTGITYKPGKDAHWYLQQAGGPTPMADRKGTFVIRADGSVIGGAGSMFKSGVGSAELRPGDMVVVPEQIYTFSTKFKSTLAIAQIATSIGSAIAFGAYYATH
jgi:protein involved in polysaccharide export with SLBB domain